MKLKIETIQPPSGSSSNDPICLINVEDNLILKNAMDFKYIMSAMTTGGVKKILLDINDLREIDSMGIGSFITIKKTLKNQDGEIAIARCSDQIMALLKPIRIENLIRFFDSVEEGINYLKSFSK